VLVSVILGAVIVVVGLQFRSSVEHAQNTIIGCILIATGIGFIALELTGHGHHHEQTIMMWPGPRSRSAVAGWGDWPR
jgi:hypothetical protein